MGVRTLNLPKREEAEKDTGEKIKAKQWMSKKVRCGETEYRGGAWGQ